MNRFAQVLLCCLIVVFVSAISTFARVTFEHTYGGIDGERGFSVAQASDGGYVIAGATMSFGAGYADVYIIKTDSLGDTLWTKIYGGSDYDEGSSIARTSDGGYIITGVTDYYSGEEDADIYLIKTNSLGDTLWTKRFGGTFDDWGFSVAQTSDGGYIIAGAKDLISPYRGDIYVIKTDAFGETIWTRTYGDTLKDVGYSVAQTSDGGYIITGIRDISPYSNGDIFLIKTDTFGDSIWAKAYGGGMGRSVAQTSDGGYIIAGEKADAAAIIRTNSLGDTIWTRTYESPWGDYANSVYQIPDEGYVIAGCLGQSPWMLRLAPLGYEVWSRTYVLPPGATAITFRSAQQTADGGYIAVGWAWLYDFIGHDDIYLVKTGPSGDVGVEESIEHSLPKRYSLFQNHPNPFNPVTEIGYTLPEPCRVKLEVYNLLGLRVATLIDAFQGAGHRTVRWDGGNLASGIYLYRIEAGEFTRTRTMALVK